MLDETQTKDINATLAEQERQERAEHDLLVESERLHDSLAYEFMQADRKAKAPLKGWSDYQEKAAEPVTAAADRLLRDIANKKPAKPLAEYRVELLAPKPTPKTPVPPAKDTDAAPAKK